MASNIFNYISGGGGNGSNTTNASTVLSKKAAQLNNNTSTKAATTTNPYTLSNTGSVFSGSGNGAYSNVNKASTLSNYQNNAKVYTPNYSVNNTSSLINTDRYNKINNIDTTAVTKTVDNSKNTSMADNSYSKALENAGVEKFPTTGGVVEEKDPDAGLGDPDTGNTTYYTELINQLMSQNEEARNQALQAILQNLDAVKGTYKQQIKDVADEYQKLVNENEVKKYRAQRVLRENQANRGQLDSGMGRQEQLELNTNYDNETIDLEAAREKAINEIYSLIAQAEAEANTNQANVNNTYNNAMLEYQLQLANASNS